MTITVKDKKTPIMVPPAVRRKAGFKRGQEIEFKVSGGVIAIVPKLPSADEEYSASQRRAIDARLTKADADVKAGRVYGPFDTAEEMSASIEANIRKVRAARRTTKRAR